VAQRNPPDEAATVVFDGQPRKAMSTIKAVLTAMMNRYQR
jgi:hypothetical protein